ncbi:Type 1 glutamine amidotransferase-like domain-containing protein [Sporosarcina highlanderae]|uniref:Type 1 glutamine amidotransferase-like domain-containing protein n=1 Tax=Sporosarcina highlanderae TaxID=3035916 RepID=A0ABT8JR88_9BACL|nr:Type 1 glutamine amidotransferase-like domain-containing protein [Sporosarcina highlanderae]MDN4607671.1 Type 1 glutamine amidotransferase-like domain-containing protein [Sporosarcina highlanderae]
MKLYLSSYKIGNEAEKLIEMTKDGNKKVAYINNALDFATDLERKNKSDAMDKLDLDRLGFSVDILDLKQYFGNKEGLKEKLDRYDVLWVRGGNTFVLAQAMKLSGFDEIVKKYYEEKKEILYGGYSAGACILGPTLKGIHLADDPDQKPYGDEHQTIWEGLHLLDYVIAPHYKSDHPESEDIDKSIEYMVENKILFKALKDGEVIIVE